jgi:GNS1/SUR4 family
VRQRPCAARVRLYHVAPAAGLTTARRARVRACVVGLRVYVRYHHAITVYFTWLHLDARTCLTWLMCSLNLAVQCHVLLYAYYALAAVGVDIWYAESVQAGAPVTVRVQHSSRPLLGQRLGRTAVHVAHCARPAPARHR